MLQELQSTLTQKKGKSSQQEVINQLNEQIEKDVAQIMEGRMREATLNKLVDKLQSGFESKFTVEQKNYWDFK